MMHDIRSPENILAATVRIRDELPELVGVDGWATIAAPFVVHLEELRHSANEGQRRENAVGLVMLLKPYPVALRRLDNELRTVADLRAKLEADLAVFAAGIGIEANMVRPSATVVLQALPAETTLDHSSRLVTIRPGGIGGAMCVKFRNIDPDLGDIAEFAAGTVMTGADIVGLPHPVLVAAGILLTIRSLYNMMTKEISEREASVFWGFIKAHDKENTANEERILEYTNSERAKFKFGPLSEGEVMVALRILEELKTVELVEGRWKIIEDYQIV
jgi:hypothetical protein